MNEINKLIKELIELLGSIEDAHTYRLINRTITLLKELRDK